MHKAWLLWRKKGARSQNCQPPGIKNHESDPLKAGDWNHHQTMCFSWSFDFLTPLLLCRLGVSQIENSAFKHTQKFTPLLGRLDGDSTYPLLTPKIEELRTSDPPNSLPWLQGQL